MARTGLTPEVHEEIVKAVAAGVPVPYACSAVGVSYDTARRWLTIGRGHIERQPSLRPETRHRYEQFAADIDAAQAQAVRRNVLYVQMAAQRDWKAAGWWLERTQPEDFGRQTRVTLQSADALERELRELLGPERANALIQETRKKLDDLRHRQAVGWQPEGVSEVQAEGGSWRGR